ncbi:MAG: molybdopterin oxidoreductase family protein, partial [Minicystis sp.]
LVRAEGRGFEPVPWDDALGRTVGAMKRIQAEHGRDAYAVLTGASLTNEKTYLMGKLARVALRTANIDYNGRLCMVSAAAASKKILGIDRAANPWSDIPKAKVILIAGANVAECAPITTDYLWQAREAGAKIIVLDPRMTPIARSADLFIPVRPGGDIGVFNGMLHVMIERGMIDRAFIEAHTTGWAEVEQAVRKYTPEYAAKIAGVPASMIVRAAELWGPAKTSFLLHARGIEHHSKGVENCMAAINLVVATGRIGREGSGYAMITGQGNGQGGREQGQKCDQLPGARDIENPAHRKHMAEVWGVPEESIPHKGVSAMELVEKIHAREIKGLLLICFNPLVSLPDQAFVKEALERLEHFTVIDFFLSETARHADVVLPGSLMEEDEGTTTNVEGRVILHRKVVDPPEGARTDWRIICDLAAKLGAGDKFSYGSPRDIFEELRRASRGGVSDYYGITWEKIEAQHGVFWPCPSLDHPGTPRLYEGHRFGHPDGKAHFQPVEWRPAAEEPDSAYPIILTTGRVVAQYLSGTQTRRIGALDDQAPQPSCEMHPRLAEQLGVADGDFVRVESRRGAVVVRALVVRTIRPDTVFVPYHWPLDRAANRCTIRALDPISKIPEFKICAVRVSKAPTPDDTIARLMPEAGGIR